MATARIAGFAQSKRFEFAFADYQLGRTEGRLCRDVELRSRVGRREVACAVISGDIADPEAVESPPVDHERFSGRKDLIGNREAGCTEAEKGLRLVCFDWPNTLRIKEFVRNPGSDSLI